MASGQDIVNSAYKLLGAPYRFWTLYAPLPMWLDDTDEAGNSVGNPPSAEYLVNGIGVMCSDLVSWAMMDNGLDTVYGTAAFENFLNSEPFSLDSPGQPGAIAYDPYLQQVARLLTHPHRRCMLLTEKTSCARTSVAYDVVVQPHCKPL